MTWVFGIGMVIVIAATIFIVYERDIKRYKKQIEDTKLRQFSIDDASTAYIKSAENKYQEYILEINRKIKSSSESAIHGFTIFYKNPYKRPLKKAQKYYTDLGYTVKLSDDCTELYISYLDKIEEVEKYL